MDYFLKIIIFFTLFVTSLLAEGGAYFGVNYGVYNESFKERDTPSITSSTMAVKIGYGLRNAYAVELNIEKTQNLGTSIVDGSGNDIEVKPDSKLGINVALLKAFDPDIYVLPFIKAGFGAGKVGVVATGLDLEGKPIPVNSLKYGSFNIGLGLFIPLGENYEIEIAYDYKYLSYENLDSSTTSNERGPEFQSHVNSSYVGLNYRF